MTSNHTTSVNSRGLGEQIVEKKRLQECTAYHQLRKKSYTELTLIHKLLRTKEELQTKNRAHPGNRLGFLNNTVGTQEREEEQCVVTGT